MLFGIDLIQIIQTIGYPGIFAIVLAESGIFFGVSLPGGSLLFTAGLLASQGYLNIYILATTVFVAAVLGDTIGYWFGAWIGPALYRRKDSRFFKQSHLAQTKLFFEEHGPKAILLGRFIPIIRTFIAILAGVAGMRYRTFFLYNVLGALIWGGGFVLGGYYLGTVIPDIEKYITLIILTIVAVTMIPFFMQMRKGMKGAAAARAKYTGGMGEHIPTGTLADATDQKLEKTKPRGVIFDLDDTLAPPYGFVEPRLGKKLAELTHRMPVAIMSAASFERIAERALRDVLPHANASNLYIFSASTGQCYQYENDIWRNIYDLSFSEDERRSIIETVTGAFKASGVLEGGWNEEVEHFEDSGASITFVAVGLEASPEEKRAWDPDTTKRIRLQQLLQPLLPEYDILIGGRTSLDIVKKNINKEYGVRWLAEKLGIAPKQMVFIGDAFYEGGNDAKVIPTGIKTQTTSGPAETEKFVDEILA